MTPQEAIDFLDEMTSRAQVNRGTHDKIKEALTVLRKAITAENALTDLNKAEKVEGETE